MRACEKTPKAVDPNVRSAERRLEEALGTRVRIKDRKGRGEVVIEYNCPTDTNAGCIVERRNATAFMLETGLRRKELYFPAMVRCALGTN
jgi:hypothetical protein